MERDVDKDEKNVLLRMSLSLSVFIYTFQMIVHEDLKSFAE